MQETRTLFVVVAASLITCVITYQVATHLINDELVRRDLHEARAKVQSLQEALESCRSHSIRPGQPIGQPAGSPMVPIPEPEPTLAR